MRVKKLVLFIMMHNTLKDARTERYKKDKNNA